MPKKQLAFFADHCVHAGVIEALRQAGWQIETAAEVGLTSATDDSIFQYVLKTKQILLTFDADFGNILRFDIKKSFGVIVVYVNNVKKDDMINMIIRFLQNTSLPLRGKLFIIEHNQVRVWPKSLKPYG